MVEKHSSSWSHLKWDSNFFGFPVGIIPGEVTTPVRLGKVIRDMRADGIRLAYWPAPWPISPCLAEAAQVLGGIAVDTKTRFELNVRDEDTYQLSETVIPIDAIALEDSVLKELAVVSGSFSRFQRDPRIPRAKFEQLYELWLRGCLSGQLASIVFASYAEGVPVGVVSCAIMKRMGRIVLLGVLPTARQQGYGVALVHRALAWFADNACDHVEVVTQGENMVACELYRKSGFKVAARSTYYHLWLQSDPQTTGARNDSSLCDPTVSRKNGANI